MNLSSYGVQALAVTLQLKKHRSAAFTPLHRAIPGDASISPRPRHPLLGAAGEALEYESWKGRGEGERHSNPNYPSSASLQIGHCRRRPAGGASVKENS